jgi:glycosyltransferase involved in cell wall biosynthesis
LRAAPRDIEPSCILFEDGAFANELRGIGVPVDIVAASDRVTKATRERGSFRAALDVPALVARVARRLAARDVAVVYTNSMKAHVVGSLAARGVGRPCIIHFHDLFEGSPLRTLQLTARAGSRERIACSSLVAATMNVGKTNVIYGPVDLGDYRALDDRATARQNLEFDDDLPVVGLIGRINRWKGHDRFLRIAARVNAKLPVRFAIVGAPIFRDADFLPELHAMVGELGLVDRVSFHGWVDDVRRIYPALDINANCSTREPFGRTIVEAAAAGVPTVCFNDSGASETIVDGRTGRTIPPGDEDSFAAAIVHLLEDRSRLETMSSAARAAAGRFDAPVIAEEMAAVIRRVAGAGPTPG